MTVKGRLSIAGVCYFTSATIFGAIAVGALPGWCILIAIALLVIAILLIKEFRRHG